MEWREVFTSNNLRIREDKKRQKIELENDHVEQSLSITFNQVP